MIAKDLNELVDLRKACLIILNVLVSLNVGEVLKTLLINTLNQYYINCKQNNDGPFFHLQPCFNIIFIKSFKPCLSPCYHAKYILVITNFITSLLLLYLLLLIIADILYNIQKTEPIIAAAILEQKFNTWIKALRLP